MTSLWAWLGLVMAVAFVVAAGLAVEEAWTARRRR